MARKSRVKSRKLEKGRKKQIRDFACPKDGQSTEVVKLVAAVFSLAAAVIGFVNGAVTSILAFFSG